MTTFASKYNKTSVNFGIDTKEYQFAKLATLYTTNGASRVYTLNGCYIHNSPLGTSPMAIVSELKLLVNLPTHLTDTIRQILTDPEAIAAIKADKVGFTIYEYKSQVGRICYSIRFTDIEPK